VVRNRFRKLTLIIKTMWSYSVIRFCNLSLFTSIFWNFYIKTIFEKFVEICVQRIKNSYNEKKEIIYSKIDFWQISFEKCVYCRFFLYLFRRRFLLIKKNRFWKRNHPNGWFWKSTLRSSLIIIHHYNFLYVSNES